MFVELTDIPEWLEDFAPLISSISLGIAVINLLSHLLV
jgi:hypothetical protein